MGNYKFKLSDMMPNTWFYKLRDMNKLKNHPSSIKNPSLSSTLNPRKYSYYTPTGSTRMDIINSPTNPKFFDTPFPYDPSPSKSSSNKKSKRKTIYMPSPRKITQDGPSSSDDQDDSFSGQSMSPCSCEFTSSASDIIIGVDVISNLQLPPINVAKSKKLESNKNRKNSTGGRKSGGVRIRRNGRRKSVKLSSTEKKGLFCSESFAVVKASFDPEKDFRDSMMEMIVENNIRESKDLEDLLACYLSLNGNQYHDQIIKAFEQIWFKFN